MTLPNLFLGGAQKSGTTALHRFLEKHPEVYTPPDRQEIHFFDEEASYARGLDGYRSLFAGAAGRPVVFQTSPLYLFDPKVPERIHRACPDARHLFILRQPVDRAYSHYWHEVRFGRERLSFEAALAAEDERVARSWADRRHYSYVARGRYAEQLDRYFRLFGRERVRVVLTDDLRGDLPGVAESLGSFLGLDPSPWHRAAREAAEEAAQTKDGGGGFRRNRARLPRSRTLQRLILPFRRSIPALVWAVEKVNLRSARYPPMQPETRRRLQAAFDDEIRALEGRIDRDLRHWRELEIV